MSTDTDNAAPPTEVEGIKARSRHLRGTLQQSLDDRLTGAIAADDTQLSKFHGLYQQDDRDVRSERQRQLLEPLYSFMIRARIPGGELTSEQWRALDAIADTHANGSIRLTTRQAVQFHGVFKRDLKASMQAIDRSLLDTLAACGDVNRNVMATANPARSGLHAEVYRLAGELSRHLTPATGAYREIWLNGEKVTEDAAEIEPIYGDTYLPRKFKLGVALPPDNDIDVYSQDLAFVAVVSGRAISGYQVLVGGGMGMSHGEPATYPRLATPIGVCAADEVIAVAEAVVTTQRDFGDRTNRKHARLKYTIDDRGIDWFRGEVEARAGVTLGEPGPPIFAGNGDRYGWVEDENGRWHYTLFIENGRVADRPGTALKSCLAEIAAAEVAGFRLTPNQNLILTSVDAADRGRVDALFERHGVDTPERVSPLRRLSLACVGLPTCGLAMAESERYLPELVTRIDALLDRHGLGSQPITIRMTGCPNGCARPYIAEIGLVGKGPGRYQLYLGASSQGDRLNVLYGENLDEAGILATLEPLFVDYAADRRSGESFGDFLIRHGVVAPTGEPGDFHARAN
ncbi:MAG: NADPH-dependent assimilatory sulfite reductase hemoprotein subunit [Pseudomonadota bacterium]